MAKWLLVSCALLAVAGLARAEDKRPSRDERKRYGAALQRARQAQAAGKLVAAAKALDECLQILPDDAVALTELGATQLRANQLDKAEATSRKAVARSQTVSVRAAALYNLGVILDKRGDKPGAIESYQGSLRLRTHPVVEAALRKLDPKLADALRFVPRVMRAVATSDAKALVKEQCWKSVADAWPDLDVEPGDVAERFTCTEAPTKLALAGTPFLDVKLLRSVANYNWPKEVDTLAIRTAQGWFLAPFERIWSNRWTESSAEVKSVELRDVGKSPALVVRWTDTTDDWPWDLDPARMPYDGEGRQELTTYVLVAGIGASGTPSATPPIPVAAAAAYGADDPKPKASAQLVVTFPATGGIELAGPEVARTKVAKNKFADLLGALKAGTFPLEFP